MTNAISLFETSLRRAVDEIRKKWATRESVDIHEFMLDVAAFRNFDMFDSIGHLLEREQVSIAELLLRPLFEGTVLLEWCVSESAVPNPRVLRFRRTCFEETLELIDSGYLHRDPAYAADLKKSLEWFNNNQIKRLPTVPQMLEEVKLVRAGLGNDTWRFLSKLIHGRFENWHDFARSNRETGTRNVDRGDSRRTRECRSLAGYLTLQTMHFMGRFDSALALAELDHIDVLWSAAYQELGLLSA
jgi:hypothetical protein